jgi:hypothetical protein
MTEPRTFDEFLEGLGPKDRLNVERHLTALEVEPGRRHAKLWRRIALILRRLAPRPVRTVGQHVVQFFVPDGKYQMQVFCLEDNRDGRVIIYMPDVLAEAQKAGILGKPPKAKPGVTADLLDEDEGVKPKEYPIPGAGGETLQVEALTPANSPDPPAHMKHMLGWNRKALRLTLPAESGSQADAVEAMCAIAARAWAEA